MRTLVLVAMAAVVAACTHTSGPRPAAPVAATSTPMVVTRADAVHPEKGKDYRLLATLRGSDASRAEAVTRSGKVVLGYSPRSGRLALLDPTTGHRKALPPMGPVGLLSAEGPTWTFVRTPPRHPPVVVLLDRATDRVRRFSLPEVPRRHHATVLGVDGRTVWFTTNWNDGQASSDRLWSIRFGRPGSLAPQGHRSSVLLADGTLAWVTGPTGGPDVIVTRAAAGGPVTKVTLPEQCVARPDRLLSAGTRIVADTTCLNRLGGVGGASELRSQPTFVVDPSTGVVAELRVEPDEGALQASTRMVSFYWDSFDLATGRLYDVSDRVGGSGMPPTTGPGAHPVALWPRGHGDHARVLVVRLI